MKNRIRIQGSQNLKAAVLGFRDLISTMIINKNCVILIKNSSKLVENSLFCFVFLVFWREKWKKTRRKNRFCGVFFR
jgi:hypothetical protein